MIKSLIPVIARLLAFISPLLLLYFYSQYVFDQVREREHRGDPGLGIAIFLGFICFAMLLCFVLDLIVQIARKRVLNGITDVFIIALLCMPIGWFACNFYDGRENAMCTIPVELFSRFLNLIST